MADLTRDGVVVSLGLRIDDIIMAIVADLMTGVLDLECGGFFECGGTVVPVFSEIAGDEEASDGYERGDDDHKQYDQAFDLFGKP